MAKKVEKKVEKKRKTRRRVAQGAMVRKKWGTNFESHPIKSNT